MLLRSVVSRGDNRGPRCAACRLDERRCLCALLPRLETRTRLVLVLHRDEAHKPTNTGQLAARCIINSEVLVRGRPGEPVPRFCADAATQPLLLFPHDDALPLAAFAASARPVTLIVPDGTWRQAARVSHRLPGLEGVPRVALPPEAPSGYRVRAGAHAERVPTLEAIARAFGVLEGAAVREALERLHRALVERTLAARGTLGTLRRAG